MESETRGSRRVFFALSEPSPVQISMRSLSRPTQMGTLCGEPSGIRVARWAKLGESSKALISSESGIAIGIVLHRGDEQFITFSLRVSERQKTFAVALTSLLLLERAKGLRPRLRMFRLDSVVWYGV